MSLYYKCDACFDRGFYIHYRNGNRMSLGERIETPCPHCQGEWSYDTKQIDKSIQEALAWFRHSIPPEKPFRLNKFKFIDDPKKLWTYLKQEIATDNIYALERIGDDLIALQGMFGGCDL